MGSSFIYGSRREGIGLADLGRLVSNMPNAVIDLFFGRVEESLVTCKRAIQLSNNVGGQCGYA